MNEEKLSNRVGDLEKAFVELLDSHEKLRDRMRRLEDKLTGTGSTVYENTPR